MPDDEVPQDELHELILSELRASGTAAIRAGADPEAVTADLTERLRRVKEMLAALEKPPDQPGG